MGLAETLKKQISSQSKVLVRSFVSPLRVGKRKTDTQAICREKRMPGIGLKSGAAGGMCKL